LFVWFVIPAQAGIQAFGVSGFRPAPEWHKKPDRW